MNKLYTLLALACLSITSKGQIRQLRFTDSSNERIEIGSTIIDNKGDIVSICQVFHHDYNVLIKTNAEGNIKSYIPGLPFASSAGINLFYYDKIMQLRDSGYLIITSHSPWLIRLKKDGSMLWRRAPIFNPRINLHNKQGLELPSGDLIIIGTNVFRHNVGTLNTGFLTYLKGNTGEEVNLKCKGFEYIPYHKGEVYFNCITSTGKEILVAGESNNNCYIWRFDTTGNYLGSLAYQPAFILNGDSYFGGSITQIFNVDGKIYLSGFFHNKESYYLPPRREAHFVVEYDTATNNINGKMFAFHNKPFLSDIKTHIPDTTKYYFAGIPSNKFKNKASKWNEVIVTKVENDSIHFSKKIVEPINKRIESIVTKGDSIIMTGSYNHTAGYYCYLNEKSVFNGDCNVVDTTIISLDISGTFTKGPDPRVFLTGINSNSNGQLHTEGLISSTEICSSDTSTVAIANITNDHTTTLYPNPNNGSFTIHTIESNKITKQNLHIFDILGRSIDYTISYNHNRKYNIKLNNKVQGIIYCIIKTDEKIASYKVLVD